LLSVRNTLPVSFGIIVPHPRPTPFPYTTLFRSPEPTTSARAMIPATPEDAVPALDTPEPAYACDFSRDIPIFQQVTASPIAGTRSEEHTSELQSRENLVCRLLLVKKQNSCTSLC